MGKLSLVTVDDTFNFTFCIDPRSEVTPKFSNVSYSNTIWFLLKLNAPVSEVALAGSAKSFCIDVELDCIL